MKKLKVKRKLFGKDPLVPRAYINYIQSQKKGSYEYFMIENRKDIVLIVEVEGFECRAEYNYTWVLNVRKQNGTIASDGNPSKIEKHSKSKKMEFRLSNCYCSDIISINVSWVKQKQHNTNSFNFLCEETRPYLFNQPKQFWQYKVVPDNKIDGRFVALCLPKFISINWYNERGEPISQIEVDEVGYILINCEGLNNERINCYTSQLSSIYPSTRDVLVVRNQARLPFKFMDTGITDRMEAFCTVSYDFINETMQSKSITVIRSGEKKISRKQQQMLNQPVVVGVIEQLQNNFKPCKFTAINLKSKDADPIVLFDEKRIIESLIFRIVSGQFDNRMLLISLENHTLSNCNAHKKTGVLITKKGTSSIIIQDKCTINASYIYGLVSNIAVPLDCFWPVSAKLAQTTLLKIETCRHKKTIQIEVYPDVRWTIAFSFGKDSLTELTNYSPSKKRKLRKRGITPTETITRLVNEWRFELKCEWNSTDDATVIKAKQNGNFDAIIFQRVESAAIWFKNGQLNIEPKTHLTDTLQHFAKKKLLMRFKKIWDCVSKLITSIEDLGKKVASASELDTKSLTSTTIPNFRKIVSPPKFQYPSCELNISWMAATNNSDVGILFVGEAYGTIIGVTVEFDLFALASSFGNLNTALFILDNLFYYVMSGKVHCTLVIKGLISTNALCAYNGALKETDFRFNIEGALDISISLKLTIEPRKNGKIQDNFQFSIFGTGGIYIRYRIIPKDNGFEGELTAGNKPVIGGIFVKDTVKDETDAKKIKEKQTANKGTEQRYTDATGQNDYSQISKLKVFFAEDEIFTW